MSIRLYAQAGVVSSLFMLSACASNTQTNMLFLGNANSVNASEAGRSWIEPAAKTDSLLYVSDTTTNNVSIFSYPSDSLIGIIVGFNKPEGLCSSGGTVYVVNSASSDILAYIHGSVEPSLNLNDHGYVPQGCAEDPHSGLVAVANVSSTASGSGNVVIYSGAQGTSYSVPGMAHVMYAVYDSSDDLFVDGTDTSGTVLLAELKKKKTTFKPLTVKGAAISGAGALLWDGDYIAIKDTTSNTIYQTKDGAVVGQVNLSGASSLQQLSLNSNTLLGADSGSGSIEVWTYPAGDNPTKVITGNGLSTPFGVTLDIVKTK